MAVAQVVRALAHTPRHLALSTKCNMAVHDRSVRLIQHGEWQRTHDERRHQILEHAAAPRDQRGCPGTAGERAIEMEPVIDRYIVLCDGDEACKSRFRSEQIVI